MMHIPTPLDDAMSPRHSSVPPYDFKWGLRSNAVFQMPAQSYVKTIAVDQNEDCTLPFALHMFEFDQRDWDNHIVSCRGVNVLEPTMVRHGLSEALFDKARDRVQSLKNDWFEIWPADHNVNEGFHFPDPWGEVTEILKHLEARMDTTKPPVNHNKISSRRSNKFGCDELHLDSFEGMRVDAHGHRQRVFRHFLNLGTTPRTTLVAVNDIDFVDRHIGHAYKPDYLDPIISACGQHLPIIKLTLPPRDPETNTIYGYKLLTTHLVHGEYGEKGDLLAIVNSMD